MWRVGGGLLSELAVRLGFQVTVSKASNETQEMNGGFDWS